MTSLPYGSGRNKASSAALRQPEPTDLLIQFLEDLGFIIDFMILKNIQINSAHFVFCHT